jgi:hypothetical protein
VDSAKINDWLQIVGLFGVVGSLMFVGLQMRQDREIALSAATQARTDTTIQNIMGTASNPFYMSALDKIAAGQAGDLAPSEQMALFLTGTAALFNFENVHYQYLSGFIPDERWRGTRQALKGVLTRLDGTRRVYESNPGAWRESFQKVVNELIAEIDVEEKQ